jgi:hypothetical protein
MRHIWICLPVPANFMTVADYELNYHEEMMHYVHDKDIQVPIS